MADTCKHTTITVAGEHVACVDCGQHEMFVEIDSASLAGFLKWVEGIHETCVRAGMDGVAETLRQRAGELIVNKRLVWKLPSLGGT